MITKNNIVNSLARKKVHTCNAKTVQERGLNFFAYLQFLRKVHPHFVVGVVEIDLAKRQMVKNGLAKREVKRVVVAVVALVVAAAAVVAAGVFVVKGGSSLKSRQRYIFVPFKNLPQKDFFNIICSCFF